MLGIGGQNNILGDNLDMVVPEFLQHVNAMAVRRLQGLVGSVSGDVFVNVAHRCEMVEKLTMLSRHVFFHFVQIINLLVGLGGMRSVGGMLHAQQDVQRLDQRALGVGPSRENLVLALGPILDALGQPQMRPC